MAVSYGVVEIPASLKHTINILRTMDIKERAYPFGTKDIISLQFGHNLEKNVMGQVLKFRHLRPVNDS